MESKISELKKANAGALKASNTASNNHADSFKKQGEALTKKILALQNKK
jgi:hypothetical protein